MIFADVIAWQWYTWPSAVVAIVGFLFAFFRWSLGKVIRAWTDIVAQIFARDVEARKEIVETQNRIATAQERTAAILDNHLTTLYAMQQEALVHIKDTKETTTRLEGKLSEIRIRQESKEL